MADSATHRTSQIPVMTPRGPHKSQSPSHSSNSSLPSSLSSPLLGLVPPTRYPSVSGSPTLPSSASASPSSPSSSSGGGFRSFRNFLSFGSNKHAHAHTQPSPTNALPKTHFGTLGPVRRSVQVERRASSPQLYSVSRRSEDDYVLEISGLQHRPGGDRSAHTHTNTPARMKRGGGPTQSPGAHSPLADSPASPSSPPAIPTTELSTILESDLSGISKHLPSLESNTSLTSNGEGSESGSLQLSPNSFQPPSLLPPPRETRHGSVSPSIDNSILDFSTSKLTSEVLAAFSESGGNQGDWLHGVVVDDVPSDTPASRERTPEIPSQDSSFHLSSLDPDLAALLSPNRAKDSAEPALLLAINAIAPPASSPPIPTFKKLPSHEATVLTPTAETFSNSSMRRLPPASLSVAPCLPSSVIPLSRITRSASDRPSLTSGIPGPPSPIGRTPSARAMSSSPERPSPLSSTPQSRSQHGTPATAAGNASIRRPCSSTIEGRKTAASRLTTPSRPSSSSATSSRPPLSRLNSTQTSAWEGESASPSSRPASSLDTSSSRLQNHRPSLDTERPRLTGSVRSRKRSSSVIEHRVTGGSPQPAQSSGSRMADWLGPRTAKAFAAAGLLDFEKDSPGSASRPPSRFGTSRSSIDRGDSRSRYAPSRIAFSEAGSSSSWGARSGSISRAAGYSEGISIPGAFSDATSTPRTTFSSASTAATSVSASSMQHMQTEIQQLQEKHALETSALLNALADSQRTTRMLREENGQLRDRIQMVEDKLADAQERIQQIIYSQPPPPIASKSKSIYAQRYGSPASSGRRSLTHSRTNSFLQPRAEGSPYGEAFSSPEPPCASPETPMDNAEAFVPPGRKRMSTTSSVFATLPSNMSMLMHEEGASPDGFAALSMHSSSPSGSPTMILPRLQVAHKGPPSSSSRGGYSHRANRSMSSAGNVSPTTTSFSMVTGSPGSLNLRPEHELHLGDMAPLDLDADDELEFDSTALR